MRNFELDGDFGLRSGFDHVAYGDRHSHPCVFNDFRASPLVYHHSPEAQFPHMAGAGIDEFNNPLATLLAIGRS